jgi:hypothetical protein
VTVFDEEFTPNANYGMTNRIESRFARLRDKAMVRLQALCGRRSAPTILPIIRSCRRKYVCSSVATSPCFDLSVTGTLQHYPPRYAPDDDRSQVIVFCVHSLRTRITSLTIIRQPVSFYT